MVDKYHRHFRFDMFVIFLSSLKDFVFLFALFIIKAHSIFERRYLGKAKKKKKIIMPKRQKRFSVEGGGGCHFSRKSDKIYEEETYFFFKDVSKWWNLNKVEKPFNFECNFMSVFFFSF